MYEERISHLRPNNCYQAHLSIYYFARSFCNHAVVLDAGCGTGYGSAYLADGGASHVYGIDADRTAIASSQQYFSRPNLQYLVQDLRSINAFEDQFFDVIVASNSLEHVEGVEKFFFSAVRLLKPSGILMIAVPIVRNQEVVAEQLSNPFHVNLWSAGHWFRTLTSYFKEVECHAHLFNGAESPELDTRSAVATFRENDFLFPAVELEDLTRLSSYTSIFVASKALPIKELPPGDSVAPIADHSVTRSLKPFWARPFLWLYYRSVYIVRYQGVIALFQKALARLHR